MASKEQRRTGVPTRKAGAPRLKNKKSLGQHWLKNRGILEEIADLAAGATPVIDMAETTESADLAAFSGAELSERPLSAPLSPLCLEIGPGLGTLTSSLLRRFPKVVAVEFDADLARKLPASFPGKNLEVIQGDILDFDFGRLTEGTRTDEIGAEDETTGAKKQKKIADFVVAGNIPYYITSPIIEKLLRLDSAPRRIVLLVQKEVAERVVA